MRNIIAKVKARALAVKAAAVSFLSLPVAAFAQIDTTAATDAITDGATAVGVILLALAVAYFGFFGLRMIKTLAKRGG